MGLTLHVGARSSGIDRMLTDRWRAGGGLLVARDDHSLGQALDLATACLPTQTRHGSSWLVSASPGIVLSGTQKCG